MVFLIALFLFMLMIINASISSALPSRSGSWKNQSTRWKTGTWMWRFIRADPMRSGIWGVPSVTWRVRSRC